MALKHGSNHWQGKQRNEDVKRPQSSSRILNEKDDPSPRAESVETNNQRASNIYIVLGPKTVTFSDSSVDNSWKSLSHCNIDLSVVHPVDEHLPETLACNTYCLTDKWSHYDEEVARTVARHRKHVQVQMKPLVSNSFTPLLFSVFCQNVNFSVTKRFPWMAHLMAVRFLRSILPLLQFAPTLHKNQLNKCEKEGTVMSYCEAVNNLLERYATDKLVAKTDKDTMYFMYIWKKWATDYSQAFRTRQLDATDYITNGYSRTILLKAKGIHLVCYGFVLGLYKERYSTWAAAWWETSW